MELFFFKSKYLIVLAFIFLGNLSVAESPEELKKKESQIRQEMIEWSQQLGVTCTECHSLKNFKNDQLKSFQVGLEHAKIVQVLRKNGFDGIKGPLANCMMCHRGELRPQIPEEKIKKTTKGSIFNNPKNSEPPRKESPTEGHD